MLNLMIQHDYFFIEHAALSEESKSNKVNPNSINPSQLNLTRLTLTLTYGFIHPKWPMNNELAARCYMNVWYTSGWKR